MTREVLPDRRRSWRRKAVVAGQSCYLTVGLYSDGRPGEVFVDVAKAGTAMKAMLSTIAIYMSIALQHGAPLKTLLDAVDGLDFEPSGEVAGSECVASAKSILDWMAKELQAEFL